jgi:3',5'-cyclic AMP phosphodiesterase CpdA
MRRIIHISDVHFGKINYEQIQPLTKLIHELAPNVTVVSGDLTQRARAWEYSAARKFLDGLPTPQIVIPGNHDVPLYNLFARVLFPLTNYKKFISPDLEPFYQDDEIVVQGVNTARSLTFKNGRINGRQIKMITDRFSKAHKDAVKVVVTHHPLDAPAGFDETQLLRHATAAIEELSKCGADLFLAGHLHLGHIGNTINRYRLKESDKEYAALIVSAGTATSSRLRGETNSFNVIEVEPSTTTRKASAIVQRFGWDPDQHTYVSIMKEEYVHAESGDKKYVGWHQPGMPEGATESSTADVPPSEQDRGAAIVEDA